MDNLKTIYTVIYLVLIAIIFFFLIRLFIRMKKMMAGINATTQEIGHLSENMAIVDQHLDTIRHSAAAWEFFAGWIIIFRIIKETLKNNKEDNLGRSFRKALIRNSRNLSSIKL